jgi:hypothetical protein
VYGTPGGGRCQYAHPHAISLILAIAFAWNGIDERPFGVGNISLADGAATGDHHSHRNGLQIDIRPLRKDGRRRGCTIYERDYDRAATARLIGLFNHHPLATSILFNDASVPHVQWWKNHHDHFHVQVRA